LRCYTSATEDAFASLVTAALTTLVSALEARTEIATGITKINWGTLEAGVYTGSHFRST
jgi:hypothetical protein